MHFKTILLSTINNRTRFYEVEYEYMFEKGESESYWNPGTNDFEEIEIKSVKLHGKEIDLTREEYKKLESKIFEKELDKAKKHLLEQSLP